MNRLQRLKNRAHRKGVHVIPALDAPGLWDIYVEKETILGPRGLQWPKRKAIRLAHEISISKQHKLIVSERVLTEEAEAENTQFNRGWGNRGCTCFTGCAPCSWCTHPGNPLNQAEDETAWEWVKCAS